MDWTGERDISAFVHLVLLILLRGEVNPLSCFWPCRKAYGILALQPGMNLGPNSERAEHQATARQVEIHFILTTLASGPSETSQGGWGPRAAPTPPLLSLPLCSVLPLTLPEAPEITQDRAHIFNGI